MMENAGGRVIDESARMSIAKYAPQHNDARNANITAYLIGARIVSTCRCQRCPWVGSAHGSRGLGRSGRVGSAVLSRGSTLWVHVGHSVIHMYTNIHHICEY